MLGELGMGYAQQHITVSFVVDDAITARITQMFCVVCENG